MGRPKRRRVSGRVSPRARFIVRTRATANGSKRLPLYTRLLFQDLDGAMVARRWRCSQRPNTISQVADLAQQSLFGARRPVAGIVMLAHVAGAATLGVSADPANLPLPMSRSRNLLRAPSMSASTAWANTNARHSAVKTGGAG